MVKQWISRSTARVQAKLFRENVNLREMGVCNAFYRRCSERLL
jgi:hypothetical protein